MNIPLGISLPHRSPDPIDVATIQQGAQRADALGFRELWVTENNLDHVWGVDAMTVLTYAAAVTTKIRVGVSVMVLPVRHPVHVAHQLATLDFLSGGRAVLGVGIGRDHHYAEFQVPKERRVRRLREGIELIRALWTGERVDYRGEIYALENSRLPLSPVQKPLPIWMGGDHPDAVRRAATLGDAWMGSGGSSVATFGRCVPILREALEKAGRDPRAFPISKRVFLAVADDPKVARAELDRWFTVVYRNPDGADASGVHGTPAQVRQRLDDLVGMGANHLLLNPVGRYVESLEMLASLTRG
jgi:probable F420-dependent oxidoreductase